MSETRASKQIGVLNGTLNVEGEITSNYLKYYLGTETPNSNLTAVALTDAAIDGDADADNTLASGNCHVKGAWVAGTAGNIVLPSAKRDEVVVYEQSADVAGAVKLTVNCATGDSFKSGLVLNLGSGATVKTATCGANKTKLEITVHGTNNNWGGTGSQLCFYAADDNTWCVRGGNAVITGNGAAITTLAFA